MDGMARAIAVRVGTVNDAPGRHHANHQPGAHCVWVQLRGSLVDMEQEPATANPAQGGDLGTLSGWIDAHRVRAVSGGLFELSGLERPRRTITALAWALLHPDEIRAAGGSIPPAVLLAGPVGCGKTSLARGLAALVSERVAFLEFNASELNPDHLVAIARYAEAQAAPVVVFIDELSWLGLDRGNRTHDGESRAALFALLSAISGLREADSAPILWLGATSDDPSELDPALTRPGRFSHLVTVRRPSAAVRRAHLERRLAKRRTTGAIDLDRLAVLTVGSSYAALDQVVDDAVALALSDGGPMAGVDQTHLEEAIAAEGETDDEPEPTADDRWRVSVHEASHALVGHLLLSPGEVRAISIHRVASRAGRTSIGPADDEIASRPLTDPEMIARAAVFLAGAVGERLIFGAASAGCSDDAEKAGRILLDRLASGADPAWSASWPAWPSAGPAYEDRRAAAVTSAVTEITARVEGLLATRRAGLEQLGRRLSEEGDLAGSDLEAALEAAARLDTPKVA